MDLGLAGKTAIVCASSRGLGRACAAALAEEGVTVVVNGRDETTLNATAQAIADRTGSTIIPIVADVGTPGGRQALLAAAPHPDILVNNNAGPPKRDFREIDTDAILAGVDQNMVTPIEMIKAVIDGMADRNFGRIVNITSSSVLAPIPGLDLSSGARAGLTAFLAGVAGSVAARNVTINNILPGRFDTDRLRSNLQWNAERQGRDLADMVAASESAIPARRFGQPNEFGQACAYLCSAQAGYITRQNLLIDGGLINAAF